MFSLMEPEKEEKLEQLERILQSRALHGSDSLRSFLEFVVRKTLDNQEAYLKEYVIGTEVFGRNSNFDPRSDSVVRVQARRLRSKLKEYYAGEGRADRVLIELPKGHYQPVFSYTTLPDGFGAHHDLEFENLEISDLAPLWGEFLRSPEHILVTFSNTLFHGTAETGMRLLRSLDTPIPNVGSPAMPQPKSSGEPDAQVITEHYTGVGEVMGVYFLSDFLYKVRHSFRVKRSLLLNWDDLRGENLIILGSPAEVFLIRDLPQKQDFVFRMLDGADHIETFGLVNTNPRPGEQEVYLATQEGPSRSQISEDYALISLLRGLDANHRLMILAGVTTFGTQAAAEYVTKPEYIRDLINHLNLSPSEAPPKLPSHYQIVIKVKVNGGVPVQISYVTHHVL